MIRKYLDDRNGFTLVEIIVTLAILSIVITGAFALLSFSNDVFSIGSKQYDVQNGVRVASDIITNELRYAKEVEIVDPATIPDPVTDDNHYILLNGSQAVERRSQAGGSQYTAFGLTANLSFKKIGVVGQEKVLYFYIEGQDTNQDFKISSEVLPLNLHLEPGNSGILGLAEGVAVRYQYADTTGGGGVPVNTAPYVTTASIAGTLGVGNTVEGMHDWNDDDGDPEGTAIYKWYIGNATGNKNLISGESGKTYVIRSTDKNKYIYFEVIPTATSGVLQGAAFPVRSGKVPAH